MKANVAAFQAGWNFGETTEAFSVRYEVKPAPLTPGTYRNITGNTALAYGLIAASQLAGLPLFLGSYPITPASDILHELSKHKRFGVRTFQAEDEIAAVGAALGASFGGSLGVTTTSGPGMLAQGRDHRPGRVGRAAADHLRHPAGRALHRHADQDRAGRPAAWRCTAATASPRSPVVAPPPPSDCFNAAIEAARIAVKYRTPVILLSDGYLANGSEPWRIPELGRPARPQPASSPSRSRPRTPRTARPSSSRSSATRRRSPGPWAIPGTPGLEHRIGGIEKADGTGTISYDPDNHDRMVRLRQAKIDGIAADIPPLEVDDPDGDARVLVLGWGSTFGSIGAAVRRVRQRRAARVAQAHLRHLNPFPANLGDVLRRYDKVLVPEINLGQLALLLRGRFLVDVISYNRVRGLPFRAAELAGVIQDVIEQCLRSTAQPPRSGQRPATGRRAVTGSGR